MHRTRNAAYGQPYRGFKSLPVRQPAQKTLSHKIQNAVRRRAGRTTYVRRIDPAVFRKPVQKRRQQNAMNRRARCRLYSPANAESQRGLIGVASSAKQECSAVAGAFCAAIQGENPMKFHLTAGIPAVAALCLVASAQAGSNTRSPPLQLPKSPVSASTLLIRGLKNGTIHLPVWNQHLPAGAHPGLNCTPGPCALPNVEGSAGATQPWTRRRSQSIRSTRNS